MRADTHTAYCRSELAGIADWVSIEVTRHHIGLPTQCTAQRNCCAHKQNMCPNLQTSTFTRALSLTCIEWTGCENPNTYLNSQNHLEGKDWMHWDKRNQINCIKSAWTRCRHTNTYSSSHFYTHLSEHEWRRQSVHTGSSWSWMCQSQQLNASLDEKVSN